MRRVNWAAGYSFEGIYRLGRGPAVRGWWGVRRVNWTAGFMRRYISIGERTCGEGLGGGGA